MNFSKANGISEIDEIRSVFLIEKKNTFFGNFQELSLLILNN